MRSLSPAQVAALKRVVAGKVRLSQPTEQHPDVWTDGDAYPDTRLHRATMRSLRDRGLIEHRNPWGFVDGTNVWTTQAGVEAARAYYPLPAARAE